MSSRSKILLVEDDSAIVTTLRRVLTDEGYEVAIELTGDAGLARAQAETFDIVLTDLRLPGLNGLELVRKLHVARPRLGSSATQLSTAAASSASIHVCRSRSICSPSGMTALS